MHNLNELCPKVVPDIQVVPVIPVKLEDHAFRHSDRFAGMGYVARKDCAMALGVALLVFVLALRCLLKFTNGVEERRLQNLQRQAAAEARQARVRLDQNKNKRRRLNRRF